jgi:hypothetical protein
MESRLGMDDAGWIRKWEKKGLGRVWTMDSLSTFISGYGTTIAESEETELHHNTPFKGAFKLKIGWI